ncbi:MAG: hypothetical protein K2G33_00695 [Duncaniella sp.]|nr:hypothetical protein [Duncaniella sp.]
MYTYATASALTHIATLQHEYRAKHLFITSAPRRSDKIHSIYGNAFPPEAQSVAPSSLK